MQFTGAVVTEQGVTFGVILVKRGVTTSSASRDEMIKFGESVFGKIPIVLVEEASGDSSRTFGRTDIVNFLKNSALFEMIPWSVYTTQ